MQGAWQRRGMDFDAGDSIGDAVAGAALGVVAGFIGRAVSRKVMKTVNDRVVPTIAANNPTITTMMALALLVEKVGMGGPIIHRSNQASISKKGDGNL